MRKEPVRVWHIIEELLHRRRTIIIQLPQNTATTIVILVILQLLILLWWIKGALHSKLIWGAHLRARSILITKVCLLVLLINFRVNWHFRLLVSALLLIISRLVFVFKMSLLVRRSYLSHSLLVILIVDR